MSRIVAAFLAAALLAAAAPAEAHDYSLGALAIKHPWARATPPSAPVAGGFVTVVNTGAAPNRLIGGSTEFAERVEIHRSTVADGIAQMREVPEGLPIPAGGELALEPGTSCW